MRLCRAEKYTFPCLHVISTRQIWVRKQKQSLTLVGAAQYYRSSVPHSYISLRAVRVLKGSSMLGSPILDLAIGMAFVYLLLSLIASVIQETIATITQARPANLARGVQSLFSGRSCPGRQRTATPRFPFMDAVYKHGLIRGLYQDPKQDSLSTEPPPPRRFANFMRRLLMKAPPFVSNVDNFLLPAYIPSRTFALAVTDLLNDKSNGGTTLQNVEAYLVGLQAKSQQKVDDAVARAKAAGNRVAH